MSVYAVFYDIG